MEIYLTGTDVNQAVTLQDRNGNALDVESVSYRVVDMNDVELVALTLLDSFTSGDTLATVFVPAVDNTIVEVPADASITSRQIDTFNTREIRTVELACLLASGNTVMLKSSYGLEHSDPLRIGINSFQALPQAELTALDIPGVSAWDAAADVDKIAALIAARSHICQLNFWLLNSNTNWGQDSLCYVPEGSYTSPYAGGGQNIFIFNGNVSLLTPTQYGRLPERFKSALRLAQLAEANSILGGDPTAARRQEGLLLESIGEVKQMFRAGKPIDLPVCKSALRYLSAFVTFSKRIGRG